jgi:hypothetical protein
LREFPGFLNQGNVQSIAFQIVPDKGKAFENPLNDAIRLEHWEPNIHHKVKGCPFTQIPKEVPKRVPQPDKLIIRPRGREGIDVLMKRAVLRDDGLQSLGVLNACLNFATVPNHLRVIKDALEFAVTVVCDDFVIREMTVNDRQFVRNCLGLEARLESDVDELLVMFVVRKASSFDVFEVFQFRSYLFTRKIVRANLEERRLDGVEDRFVIPHQYFPTPSTKSEGR